MRKYIRKSVFLRLRKMHAELGLAMKYRHPLNMGRVLDQVSNIENLIIRHDSWGVDEKKRT